MTESQSTMAQQVAQAASTFQQQSTGHVPKTVTVVLSGDTLAFSANQGIRLKEEREHDGRL